MAIAIIGTAGRDKSKPMTQRLWLNMVEHAVMNIPSGAHVVSGGAAWADHLAVTLLMISHVKQLTLHLPAPFNGTHFLGAYGTSGGAANYYHQRFSQIAGIDSLNDIRWASQQANCDGSFEPVSNGYAGMFARNAKVALADEMLAYTWGEGDQPADGGTLDTWNKCKGKKTHISLLKLG